MLRPDREARRSRAGADQSEDSDDEEAIGASNGWRSCQGFDGSRGTTKWRYQMKQIAGFHIAFNPLTNRGVLEIRVDGNSAPIQVPINNEPEAALVMQLLLAGGAQLDDAGNI